MADQPQEIYANGVQVITSPFEFVLELGLTTVKLSQIPNRPHDTEAQVVARVRLSPHHAKAVAALLVQNVVEFERNWGELGLPPELGSIWENVVKGQPFTTPKK
jgi:hypothetical protein